MYRRFSDNVCRDRDYIAYIWYENSFVGAGVKKNIMEFIGGWRLNEDK